MRAGGCMHHPRSGRVLTGLAAAVLAAAGATPALAQFAEPDVSVLYTLTSDQANDGYGFVAASIGDLNGDGAPEFVVGAPGNTAGGPRAGKAFVYSGRDGALLHTVIGAPFNALGSGVCEAGDVDADGVPDYAVSGTGTRGAPFPQRGRLLVISGATHAVLLDRAGPAHLSFFGYDINAAGDLNQDGHADVIVGAPFHSLAGQFSGSIHIISGADGSTLLVQAGPEPLSLFGSAVSKVGDQTGDGKADYAVGAFGG